jgi:large subunit ribosomal protein L24
MFIRKDDNVVVISGEDKLLGPQGIRRVLRVLPDKGQVVVEGVNQVVKHIKPNRRNPKGGRLTKEMPLDVSNVMLFCTACRRGTRVGARATAEGGKERYCKKCNATMGVIRKPKKKKTAAPATK